MQPSIEQMIVHHCDVIVIIIIVIGGMCGWRMIITVLHKSVEDIKLGFDERYDCVVS